MNLKTTFVLLVLLAVVGGGWYAMTLRAPDAADSKSLDFLDKQLKPDALTRIEIKRPGQPPLVLEKSGEDWTLPGKWPVRSREVQELVRLLTTLHSRFAAQKADLATSLDKHGLGDKAVALKLTVGGKIVGMKIGEKAAEHNRFTRETYLKLDDADEIVRLGPGLIAALDRPMEYYQQRRLFPAERVAKDDDAADKIEQVAAEQIKVKGPDGEVVLVKHKEGWRLESPVKDHVDPDKLRGVLTGLVDLWADRFVTSKEKTLDEMGLLKPDYTLLIKRPGGGDVALLVGQVSESKEKVVPKPGPPPSPFGPPPKAGFDIVKEEFRYAKMPDNEQIFEIKTDKLKDVAVALGELRDARIARFKTGDVRKLEIDWKGKSLVLSKDKEKWRIEKPLAVSAESQPIDDLLDKLSLLEARGPDVRDKEDPKAVGLDAPAGKVTVTLEEGKKDPKTTRTLVYALGESEKEKGKLFVKLADWPRINAVGDDLVKLVDRDALAYRQRRLLDAAANDLARIQVTRGDASFAFERKDGAWSQVAPSAAKLEQSKVDQLAGDLARLETPEFVADAPKAEDLDKTYGLAKPSFMVALRFADEKKPTQVLQIGKQRPGKDDSFARLDDGPVFALKKDLRELLERDSFAYRPSQAWQVKADDIVELRIKKEGESFTVTKDDRAWKIAGSFSANARFEYGEAIVDELAGLRSEKYVAQVNNDLAKFGLDKPYLQFEVVARVPDKDKKDEKAPVDDKAKDDKAKDDKAKEDAKDKGDQDGKDKVKDDAKDKDKVKTKEVVSVLQIGKLDDGGKSRYARIGDGDAVFLVNEKTLAIIDRGPLDLLDHVLLKLNVASIAQIRFQGGAAFTLEKKKNTWDVAGSPAAPFQAEEDVVDAVLRPFGNLLAGKIAAYGPKIDWANYGLEKPETILVVSGQTDDKKAFEHTLALGKDAGDGKRYARIDQQPQVAVLEADTAKDLARTHVDFVNPRVLKFAFDGVTRIDRAMKGADIELAKSGDGWQLAKSKQAADAPTVDDILDKSFQLKARRVAAFPAKDLAKFGLEPPVAVVTLHLEGDKKHVLKVGDKADAKSDERFAIVDDGQAVVVLPAELSRHLTAPVLYYADRNLANFGAADRLDLTRGDRKAVFTKADAAWKLVEPVKADAEETLADFVRGLFRLRADEIVAGKDANLKSFGLDPPALEWKVAAGDKEVLDLQIGDPEKGKEKDAQPRRYARLAKGEQVFLLSSKQAAAALAEYRNRKPWAPLDAAQIEKVSVTGEASSFTLVKADGAWTIKDKGTDKVNAKTVTDLLDALASLKAERYLADAKGNLQLFGLEPPAGKIEVATPAGPRTLLLGRTEGDSRRVYAAVAGSDAVFVIGEADAARLTRPLAGYLEGK
jgi:hypothetical protein